MDKKGNVVAMAITTIIVMIGIAAFVVTFYQTPPPNVPISTALSETTISVNKAIALGISSWAETGFDQENATLYNNGNFPPSLEETKQSLRNTVKAEITKVLDELSIQRGYTYEFDDPAEGIVLEFDFDSADTVDQLNKESVTAKVSGFSVKDEKGNIVTVKEFSTEEKFDYAVWNLYSQMLEWAKNDSGDISLNLQELLDSAPYQLQICDCGVINKVTEDKIILKGSVTWEDRVDPDTGTTIQGVESYVVKPALAKLQELFADKPNVTCSYVVEDKAIENIPNIMKRGQAGCECAGGVGLENNEFLSGTSAAAWRTDDIGKPKLYYGVNDSEGQLRANADAARGFPNVESFLKIEKATPADPIVENCDAFKNVAGYKQGDELLCKQGKMCFYTDKACIDSYKKSGQNYLTIQGNNEAIGMTRRIAGLVRFKCEDNSSRVKTEEEFKNLNAEVVVRFAVLKGAEPPSFCTTEAGPICLYGSLVTLIGVECTPWDDCFLSGQIEECGVCECMSGAQIISPIGDPVAEPLWNLHESGTTFNCLDPDDPACKWCNSKGGMYKCPAKQQFSSTTDDCQALIDETVSGEKSEQCLLYECVVEDNTVKRGCAWLDNAIATIPCDSCRRCAANGKCEPAISKVGEQCIPGSFLNTTNNRVTLFPAPLGANQACYECTMEGECVVNAEAAGVAICSNSQGCYTYCSDQGTCSVIKPDDIGLQCPTNKPDYLCMQCSVKNNKLYCGELCGNGCCADSSKNWGRCIGTNGKCCPDTHTLTDCPAPT